ncbi:hypothetical protein DFA_02966 [Cavenderia fasciculata]|uniref:Ankyrin repeat-containing protein n=1 Tax=Cavenderia fasciculata TaxID=261658 RepID=F4PG88_CACFS|nr:uncharacterized protein DFA_02966 [Cavenderia fasciculata]EGG24722.1 hypothetical protein DFA_02966 [Cavenderia fasciculata]|eukprot:XP_004362573.1 hypothetical protein DFA_02966 [Cavenderia fasciculata]
MTEEDYFEDEIIFAAAKKNHISMLQEFHEQRVKKNAFNASLTDALGNTPLHYSATFGHYDISKYLLELGANPNIQNKAGETALHKAVWYNQIEIATLLIEKGADPNITNNAKQKVIGLTKSTDMHALLNQAVLAHAFSKSDYADEDEDDNDEEAAGSGSGSDQGGVKKPKPAAPPRKSNNSNFHSDMIANDSDDE